MFGWRLTQLVVGLLPAISCAAGAPVACGDEQILALSGAGPTVVRASAGEWVIRELGADVKYRVGADEADRPVDLRPPRVGEAWIKLSGPEAVAISLVRPAPSAKVSLRLACSDSDQVVGDCVRAVEAALTKRDLPGLEAVPADRGICSAFAAHARAQLLGGLTAHRRAHDEYLSARRMWVALAYPGRAAAADLGAAEQSLNAGNLDRAATEALAAIQSNHKAGLTFFSQRAQVTLGVALRRMGELKRAREVQIEALRYFESAGEPVEAANVRFNLAAAALYLGDFKELDRQLTAIRSMDAALLTPVVQARVDAIEGIRALAKGDFPQGLRYLAEGLRKAESAASLPVAMSLRRNLIDAYRSLGLIDEAYAMLAVALRTNSAAEAPSRTAQLLLSLSELDRESGAADAAVRWAGDAERIYANLGMPQEARKAHEGAAEAQLSTGDLREAKRISDVPDTSCRLAAKAHLLEERVDAALATLQRTDCVPRTLGELLEITRLNALAIRSSQSAQLGAEYLTAKTIDLRQRLAQGSAGVRYAALRQLSRLTGAWLELQRAAPEGQATLAARALHWALLTHPLDTRSAELGNAGSVSPALGLLLLGSNAVNEIGETASREVLGRFANAPIGTAKAMAPIPTLAEVQSSLDDDTWLLVVLSAAPHSLQLWISREQAWAVPLETGAFVDQAIAEAESQLAEPGTSLSQLQQSTKALSDLLLSAAPINEAPKKLWLLADEHLGAVPIPLLQWPKTGKPLLDTTRVSWITAIEHHPERREFARPAATVFVASQTRAPAETKLAPLYNAIREPEFISANLTGIDVERVTEHEATATRFMNALKIDGALVHVASHGISEPGMLGYSGLWLNSPQGAPEFLSWLDLADSRLTAGLLVLNACQLAAGPGVRRRATLSFATSLSVAGVDNVIAASAPLSDTAATVWVPAFYRALDLNDLGSSAEALRQAQLALRQSRHFRHPYYWASLAHFRRLTISSQEL